MLAKLDKKRLIVTSLAVVIVIFVAYTLLMSYAIQRTYSKLLTEAAQVSSQRPRDNLGVPFLNAGVVEGLHVGIQRNPLLVAETAMEYYERWGRGDESSRQFFLNCSDWLLSHSTTRKNYAILEYKFRWPLLYDIKPPWRSGMAQASAARVLTRAYYLSHKKKYLDTAKKLINIFFVEVKDGGVTYKTLTEGWWYEEFAGAEGKEPRVLNGMMATVLWLHDYHQLTHDPKAKFLFDRGVLALKINLPKYDRKQGYSYYDLRKNYSKKYHAAHIQLLDSLYKITDQKIFKEFRDRWAKR